MTIFIIAAPLLALSLSPGEEGRVSKFLTPMIVLFKEDGTPNKRVSTAHLKQSFEIRHVNAKDQLGIDLPDEGRVYVRRGDVAYSGAPGGPCRVVSARAGSGASLAAGDSGASRGAGDGQNRCIPD